MPSAPSTRPTTNPPPEPAGKSGSSFAHIFFLMIFLGLAYSMFSSSVPSRPSRIETAAQVLEVRPYPPSAANTTPRLWVRFAFETAAGRQMISTGSVRVKSYAALGVGDRITVSYRKRDPIRPRIVSISPPAPGATDAQTSGFDAIRRFPLLLLALVPLLVLAGVLGLWLRRRRSSGGAHRPGRPHRNLPPSTATATATASATARTIARNDERAQRTGRRSKRARTVETKPPRKKSKVVERGGWFT